MLLLSLLIVCMSVVSCRSVQVICKSGRTEDVSLLL